MYTEISYIQALTFSKTLGQYHNIVYFHSAKQSRALGRYSFIAIDPFKVWTVDSTDQHDIFSQLLSELKQYQFDTILNLPPFQGGLAGYISYDIARDIETLPNIAKEDIAYPKLILGYYDLIISFDHFQSKAWIISSGFPETEDAKQKIRAELRLHWLLNQILNATENNNRINYFIAENNIKSNFTKTAYIKAINKIKKYILKGDIFEANLTQRFECALPNHFDTYALFEKINHYNPAPFASYIQFGNLSIISSSPERFIKLDHQIVETRPIKGTIRRSNNSIEDQELAEKLLSSEKDRAENIMIVDLMRNDLSRVCEPHSVIVSQLCEIESYENIHHLVSVILGKLNDTENIVTLLKATLPGGSITGAPKIRAMEIIDKLEPTRRGPYCGNAIYIGFDGNMDSSILIRSYVIAHNKITFQAGGAIVLDSNPEEEYDEMRMKTDLLRQVLIA